MDTKALTSEEKAKLETVAVKPYHEQGQFFLNAFWVELQDKAEDVWVHWTKMKELDKQQFTANVAAGKASGDYVEGSSLDEFWSHKFLESIGKTMSIVEFRTEFKKIDANTDKRMGLIEFLVYEYKLSVQELLSRPQGGDPEEIKRAQQLLEEVSEAFQAAQKALDKASKTEAEAIKAKDAALKSEAQAKATAAAAKKTAEAAAHASAQAQKTADEAAHKAAQAKKTADEAAHAAAAAGKAADDAAHAAAEQQAAVAALKHEEESYNNKTKDLEAKSEAGGVSGMRAKNELAQHLAEDPLPLRKAKITAEAAAKKSEKAKLAAQAAADTAEKAKQAADKDREAADHAKAAADKDAAAAERAKEAAQAAQAAAEEAAAEAERDRVDAEAAAAQAEQDRIAAEERVKESEAKLAEAEAYLEEVKARGDKTYGTFWWLDRELAERKKYMPKSGKAKLLF